MTFLEKCLELAEDYTIKKQRYNKLLENDNSSDTDLKQALTEMTLAKQRYISLLSRLNRINLYEEVVA